MKKIINLLVVLIIVMITVCACDNTQNSTNNNLKTQNNQLTNQEENKNNSNNLTELDSGENVKEAIKKEQKVIYLTFDEGYENGYTGAILDTLKEKDCPATFFVTKPYVKQNQDLVKRMIDEGHIVGNHISRTSMYHIKIS